MIKLLLTCFLSFGLCSLNHHEEAATKPYYVGELGSLWQFPSDHLPVGATVGNFHFAAWNILATQYLHHIEENGQGLRDSLIMQTNIPDVNDPARSVRESMVIKDIQEMLLHPTHPRSILALEETGLTVFIKLAEILPPYLQMIPMNERADVFDLFIYNTNVFDFVNFEINSYENSKNTYMFLTLVEKQTNKQILFIQSHIPGGPESRSLPARQQLAKAVMEHYDPSITTIIMGDMNRSPDCFLNDLAVAADGQELPNPFINIWVPYPTHINTVKEACWIDNLFIANSETEAIVSQNGPEFFPELQQTIDLLDSFNHTYD